MLYNTCIIESSYEESLKQGLTMCTVLALSCGLKQCPLGSKLRPASSFTGPPSQTP